MDFKATYFRYLEHVETLDGDQLGMLLYFSGIEGETVDDFLAKPLDEQRAFISQAAARSTA